MHIDYTVCIWIVLYVYLIHGTLNLQKLNDQQNDMYYITKTLILPSSIQLIEQW